MAEQDHDVLIVGGGSAGCVLAARLSENPSRSVVLLEAGRDVQSVAQLPAVLPRLTAAAPPHDPADLWTYDVSLIDGALAARQYRGRVLGGSSAVNGSLFMRGVPEDYDSWGATWRFGEVLEYFRRTEHDLDFHDEFHGEGGMFDVSRYFDVSLGRFQDSFVRRCVALGIPEKADLNHPAGVGIGRMPVSNDQTVRTCAALTYLGDRDQRPNLTIRTGIDVRRVLFEDRRAIGVEAVDAAGRGIVLRAHEVVLSAGAFGSPGLLLRSGVGPVEDLRRLGIDPVHDLAGVGRNLSCHPAIVLAEPSTQPEDDADVPRVALVSSSPSGARAERNDLNLFPRVVDGNATVLVTLRLPSSRGSLCLRSADPDDSPEISFGYLDDHDLARLSEGIELGLSVLGRRPNGESSGGWVRSHLRTSDHACGTCRLGAADDENAVVDPVCRVRGVDGLRVVDLSIVPRSVRAGPYATVVMLAERAADLFDAEPAPLPGPPR
jgi:predicted dehydrogenase (TIGR03970 family)